MAAKQIVSVLILFAFCNFAVRGWSGNYASRKICTFTYKTVCTYRTWLGCCRYARQRVEIYKWQQYCLPGWVETSPGNGICTKPICNPKCKNGGQCVRPNKCSCPGTHTGPSCEGKLCSHLKPCYPGNCSRGTGGDSSCICHDGFQDDSQTSGCKELISPAQRPEIFGCRLRISNYDTIKKMEMFGVLLDTSDNGVNEIKEWTNRKGYNRINYTGIAFYDPPDLPPIPSDYISEVKFGIVGGKFTVEHTRGSGEEITENVNDFDCPDTSETNPIEGIYNCTAVNQNYNFQIESNDTLKITFIAEAGGYRKLVYIDSKSYYTTQNYKKTSMTKVLTYRFDYNKPEHCFPNCNRGEKVLDFGDEYRKDPKLNLSWSGWQDAISGVERYAWEIFELIEYRPGQLRELKPLEPIKIEEVPHSDNISYPTYTLPANGMYSIILQIADKANNSEYVRRFCLYDSDSKIEVSRIPDDRLRVTSASAESNYTWQGDISGSVTVSWKNYFYNSYHVENHFLDRILDYPEQFVREGLTELKAIGKQYKNTEGRTLDAIPNARGIVKFKIGYRRLIQKTQTSIPKYPDQWKNLTNPTSTEESLSITVANGDSVAVYVQATDVMGNEEVRHTLVHFDTSPPKVNIFEVEMTPESADGTSKIECVASDSHSGISSVHWKAVRLDTNRQYASGILRWPLPLKSCEGDAQCACIEELQQCFKTKAIMRLNNCELIIRDVENSVTVRVDFYVMNQALVKAKAVKSVLIKDIREITNSDVCGGGTTSAVSGGAIAGIIIALILIIILAVLVFLFVTTRAPFTKERKQFIQSKLGIAGGVSQPYAPTRAYRNKTYEPEDEDLYLYGGMDFQSGTSWQIPHKELTLLGTITEGKFATIYKAKVTSNSDTVVAKMLKDNYTDEDEMLMRAKVNYMATVVGRHPQILQFIGAVVDNDNLGPVMILEYCELGQLDKWLVSQQGHVNTDLLELLQGMAFDICKGMAYLASKQIVHKKLAARNVLLTFIKQPKITGFGPTKSSSDDYDNNTSRERIPIKWTAPECLESLKHANEKSDVWSYGIVLWEIFSLGESPYSDLKSREVESRVKEGYRMSKPEVCEEFYYKIMKNCWQENPRNRESFKKISNQIEKTFKEVPSEDFYYYRS